MNYSALFRSALVTLLRNKMRSILTVLGITIGIAAVICVVAIGKAGQARVEQQRRLGGLSWLNGCFDMAMRIHNLIQQIDMIPEPFNLLFEAVEKSKAERHHSQ